MSPFQRPLLIASVFTFALLTAISALAVRLFRPSTTPDLSGQIGFLLGENCRASDCDYRIAVTDGQGYAPLTLPVEPLAFGWSRDGSRLAYIGRSAEAAGEQASTLYVADADGTQATAITALDFLDTLSWSPDGQQITFSYNRNGDSGIYVIGSDGSGQRRLINGLVSNSPVWSPTGEWILFQVRGFQGQQIYLVDPETSGILNLTGDSAYDYAPQWSPDGEHILFLSRDRSRTFAAGNPLTQAFIMDRRGRNIRQVTRFSGNVFVARWSPTGDLLAVYVAEARADQTFVGTLYALDLAHGLLFPLAASAGNTIGDFAWSPDGTHIAYVLSPQQDSQICVQALGDVAHCSTANAARKSDLHWLTGLLPPSGE
ncbi:MAG: PD40 domain-containing protein [Anaerolineae bacterium]|nr:PD40 domain-containing protein [Anaerolineae bacterium]